MFNQQIKTLLSSVHSPMQECSAYVGSRCLPVRETGACLCRSQVPACARARCLPRQEPGACLCRSQVPAYAGARWLPMQEPGACLCRIQVPIYAGVKSVKNGRGHNSMHMTAQNFSTTAPIRKFRDLQVCKNSKCPHGNGPGIHLGVHIGCNIKPCL